MPPASYRITTQGRLGPEQTKPRGSQEGGVILTAHDFCALSGDPEAGPVQSKLRSP